MQRAREAVAALMKVPQANIYHCRRKNGEPGHWKVYLVLYLLYRDINMLRICNEKTHQFIIPCLFYFIIISHLI